MLDGNHSMWQQTRIRFAWLLAALLTAGTAGASEPESPATNACGCFEQSPGVCACLKVSRCGCPGECEPLGCEDKRQEDLARRMDEELKKIKEQMDKQPKPAPDKRTDK
jgi:hypothetical protein